MLPPMLRVIVTVASVSSLLTGSGVAPTRAAGTAPVQLVEAYGKLPLHFEANQGQTDRQVKFLSRGAGYTLFLTPREAVMVLRSAPARGTGLAARGVIPDKQTEQTRTPEQTGQTAPSPLASNHEPVTHSVLRLRLLGANPAAPLSGLDELPGKVNYLVGKDPTKWRTHVPTFAKVKQSQVYPGIDLVYYGNQRQVEFDFVLAPGANPNAIRLKVDGADRLEVDAQGDLRLRVAQDSITLQRPRVYQDADGVRTAVSGHYVLQEPNEVRFQVATYDVKRPLVIDPTLVYATYLGGSAFDDGRGIAVDAEGAAYVAGRTFSTDFPTGCTAACTVLDPTLGGTVDNFVTKLNPTGTALVYSTYLGGSSTDGGVGIAVDAEGAAYVTGGTGSTDFTAGCTAPCTVLDSTLGGGDAFVTKLNATGTALLYSTYLGGSGSEGGVGIAVDAEGAAYVMGSTRSRDFTAGCTAPCVVLDATLAGGLSGLDAFVTKLNATGTALLYSTYLGGSGSEGGVGIAVDAEGAAYVTGTTFSTDFTAGCTAPCVVLDATQGEGVFRTDAFVTKLDPTGSALVYSTYLGGNSEDAGTAIAVDAEGAAYVTGRTSSADFTAGCTAPCTVLDSTPRGDFVTKLNAAGTALLYAAFLGGSGAGIAVDAEGAAYVTGRTSSADFTAGCTAPCTVLDATLGGQADAFVAKISHVGPPATLTLAPEAATNPVNTQHCVTAMVQDALGNPTPGITVQFSVTGSVMTSGVATTDPNGQATFCYPGPRRAGTDSITGHADTDSNTVQDSGEPTGTARTAWVRKKAEKDDDDDERNEKKYRKRSDDDDEDDARMRTRRNK
jgi:hypothetical protein